MLFVPIGEFFFSSFILFYINGYFIVFIGFIYDICQRERVGRMEAAKTGPNNAIYVSFGPLGEFFFIFSLYYYILMSDLL